MQIDTALNGVSRLFLDTAPVIYEIERNPEFVNVEDKIRKLIEALLQFDPATQVAMIRYAEN